MYIYIMYIYIYMKKATIIIKIYSENIATATQWVTSSKLNTTAGHYVMKNVVQTLVFI